MLFIPHVWIGIGIFLGAIGHLSFPLVSREITATVIGKGTQASRRGSHHFQDVAYKVDHVAQYATLSISDEEFDLVSKGDVVTVKVACIFGDSVVRKADYTVSPEVLLFPLFWNAIMFLLVRELGWRTLLRFWLVKRGVRCDGVFDDVERRFGKGGGATVRFHFAPPGGGVVEGTIKVSHKIFDETSLRPLTVFFHPRWPQLNVVYELSSWEVI